ncbi:hypothetical protein CFN78_03515 [Amycolatopsis antarctica]|uniref:Transmembrane protein n=1 Tax=Amycolatopsis antarctica TaxID=1854586 RepID=A0A263DA30_9PSEU|nr:hypothetical protein CFN78_03515 [Amycolatopsis antarctica]
MHGFSELTQRMIVGAYERCTRLHRVLALTMGLLAVSCAAASVSRFSLLPVLPLPLLGLAAFALSRMRHNLDRRRRLLRWAIMFTGALFVAFWTMAVLGRYYHAD